MFNCNHRFIFETRQFVVFVITVCLCLSFSPFAISQQRTTIQLYGHIQYTAEKIKAESPSNYFSLGEQDFFVTSYLNKRLTFIGETVVEYESDTKTHFLPDIERALLKYDYANHHSLIAGKFYTPLNYWNDVYSHANIYFPTIDRPSFFNNIMPIHATGICLRGQNIGTLGFGYDLSVTNGLSANSVVDFNNSKALSACLQVKPLEGMRISASYYNDYLIDNLDHTHEINEDVESGYTGAINYELYCMSVAYFSDKLEVLSENSYNTSHTDSLGIANNYSAYLYVGYQIKEKFVPYLLFDYMDMSENELRTAPINVIKSGLGFRWELNPTCYLKLQAERYESGDDHLFHNHNELKYELKLQASYGF